MAEEFQESEVLFSESEENNQCNFLGRSIEIGSNILKGEKKSKSCKKKNPGPDPVDIPEYVAGNRRVQYVESDFFEDDEMIPPHLIIAQRISGKMAFSVCTGIGRTLKGRDLSQVRDSIMRMTGFLEA